MNDFSNIPLPQDTKLYQVSNGSILEPRVSIDSFNNNCTYPSYSDLQNLQLLFQLNTQNETELNLNFYDKNVSSLGSNYNSVFSVNGFDQGIDYRFINYSSPTVCLLPIIKATDNGSNINISSQYLSVSNFSYQNLNVNDLILLTNQTVSSQNVVYRVTAVVGSQVSISSSVCSNINSVLSQNINYIFTRAIIQNYSGTAYYGLNNTTPYRWISQTQSLQLPSTNYGFTFFQDITNNQIPLSIFSGLNINPNLGDIVAINILGGGYTTGIYLVSSILNSTVYLSPLYPNYVFFQQFVKINLDINTNASSIWYTDPVYTDSITSLYGSIKFAFKTYSVSNIQSNPALWAKQVGGANDTVGGFTLYTTYVNNNYIKYTDTFSVTLAAPQWSANNSLLTGVALNLNYYTNMMGYREEVSLI